MMSGLTAKSAAGMGRVTTARRGFLPGGPPVKPDCPQITRRIHFKDPRKNNEPTESPSFLSKERLESSAEGRNAAQDISHSVKEDFFKGPVENQIGKNRDATRDAQGSARNAYDTVRENARDAKHDAQGTARDAYGSAKDTARDAKHEVQGAARDAKHEVQGRAEETYGAAKGAAHEARDTVRDAKNELGGKLDNAGRNIEHKADEAYGSAKRAARDVRDTASDAAQNVREGARDVQHRLSEDLQGANKATLNYIIGTAVASAVAAYNIIRPEQSLQAAFGKTLSAKGAEIASLTGALSSSTFLLQAYAVVGLPIAVALLTQAHASRAGHLNSDSSMRLNFGLALHAFAVLAAFVTSPLNSNLGGASTAGLGLYLWVMASAVFYGVRHTHKFRSLSQLLSTTASGFLSTVGRVLIPRTLTGSIYGILCCAVTYAAFWMLTGRSYFSSYFNVSAPEATFALAHGDMTRLLTAGISANLAFAAVALAALKELADKGGLATRTARWMNAALGAMFGGVAILVNWGSQHSVISAHGSGAFGLITQICAAGLISSLAFLVYPESKSPVKEDTMEECY